MITLFLIVFLDLVGFGMIIPVFPFYAEQVGVNPASVIFYLGLYSLGQLVGAPVWGSLSDRFGRRPILLITLLANAAASAMLAYSTTDVMLIVSRIVAGLAAGNISAAYAYTTDITTNETRPRALGLLGSAFGLGFILGPALGGLLAGTNQNDPSSLSRVALGAAVMSLIAFVLTLVRLPESLPPEKRAQQHTKRAGMLTYLRRPVLRDLLLSTIIVVAAVALLQSTLALWAADRLQVGPRMLGWIYGFTGVISVAVQAGVIGKLTKRFGAARLTRAGALLIAIGMACIPPVHSIGLLLVALSIFSIGSAMFNPSMSGLVAAAAEPHERGSVLGAYQGAASLGRVIGPFTASAVARVGTLSWPMMVGAVVSLIGVVLIHTRPAPAEDKR
jgi:MFS transporter, DHA1 family, tetracycline resistance protein